MESQGELIAALHTFFSAALWPFWPALALPLAQVFFRLNGFRFVVLVVLHLFLRHAASQHHS